MPRPRRLNIPGIPQHVTQRGNNRQVCFFDDDDRETYLELINKASIRRACTVHAYVLMTNHIHLLVTPETADGISHFMQDIGREYVQHINKTYRRSGTLFEGRFNSSLVDSEIYCLTCYRYIELNPVRAAIVKLPEDYHWSSFRTNAFARPDSLISPHEQWLLLGSNGPARCKAYRELFKESLCSTQIDTIRRTNIKGLPLGSNRFREEIESQLQVKLGTGRIGRPSKRK